MKLIFSAEELDYYSDSDLWTRLVDDFLYNLKLIIADNIHRVHNVPRQVSLDLVRIRNYDYTSFEVGIIDSKSYSRSQKRYILDILRSENGSALDETQSNSIIRSMNKSLQMNIKYLWYDYVASEVHR